MTPQEQIAYLRARIDTFETVEGNAAILAVCDLAERALAAERLIAAVGEWDATHNFTGEEVIIDFQGAEDAEDELTDAWRAYNEAGQ
jgi:hypothetical protein